MTGIFTFLFSIWLGYILFLYFTHPEKKKHKLPRVQVWRIELSPNLRIHSRSKIYHIHHWFVLTVITGITLMNYEGFQYLTVIKGLAIGGIIQGLRYPDRFKFRHHRTAREAISEAKI
ncbi:MAG: hypothetical protein A3B38_02325 [Candidatus Levybacteria bacterium RIFCSPLOWO2_01_FULL_36_13]|nr:MAG: hypothetical protein A2684_03520 [Candidatus Levybacteria bacterium RIFCSPHIGHO2_01_FULL_36_15b]OGH35123.1 MAG: hypothetical protein A3B38_02325 [Candidatus Levybacteria bacterium RIFCSPLOWO2_01_FULL_36_13]